MKRRRGLTAYSRLLELRKATILTWVSDYFLSFSLCSLLTWQRSRNNSENIKKVQNKMELQENKRRLKRRRNRVVIERVVKGFIKTWNKATRTLRRYWRHSVNVCFYAVITGIRRRVVVISDWLLKCPQACVTLSISSKGSRTRLFDRQSDSAIAFFISFLEWRIDNRAVNLLFELSCFRTVSLLF